MKNAGQLYLQIISSLLILLWVYAAVSKLMAFELFRAQMLRQTIPGWLAIFLIWTLPVMELVLSALLMFGRTQRAGFILSAGLLALFTIYIILILTKVFGRVPCSCGGVIQALGWKLHLVFNLFFLLLSFSGLYITDRERRPGNN